ncbi:MAG: M28 family metallopeptidase [Candidatus Methylomirabilales bacterium]
MGEASGFLLHRRERVLRVGTAALLMLVPLADRLSAMATSTAIDPQTLSITSHLAARLRSHVDYLASPELRGRKPGTPGNRMAAEYIAARFREADLEPLPSLGGYGQQISPQLGDNLIGVRRALNDGDTSRRSPRWILIGAHYDHLGGRYLGADDNASAIAILLETARSLPRLPNHPVLFMAFNAEEPPFIRTPLMGSQFFVDHLPVEIGSPARLQAVIIMDLMGGVHWEPMRDVIFAAGAEKSPGLYARLKEAAQASGARLEARGENLLSRPIAHSPSPLAVLPIGIHLIEEIPLVGQVSFSDYDAFRNASVPFLFLSAGRTPRYHQTSDLPDTLHYERMAGTVGWFQSLLTQMDQDTEPYPFDATRVELADEAASLRPFVSLAAEWATRVPGTSPLSLVRMKLDDRWLRTLDLTTPMSGALKRLERISIRLQCLLADFPACFLI